MPISLISSLFSSTARPIFLSAQPATRSTNALIGSGTSGEATGDQGHQQDPLVRLRLQQHVWPERKSLIHTNPTSEACEHRHAMDPETRQHTERSLQAIQSTTSTIATAHPASTRAVRAIIVELHALRQFTWNLKMMQTKAAQRLVLLDQITACVLGPRQPKSTTTLGNCARYR